MTEEKTPPENLSTLGSCRWLLFDQFDESRADRLRSAFVFVGLATSFLAFVAATSALLQSLGLWWIALILGLLGAGTLAFVWLLALGSFAEWFETGEGLGADAE
ncbi:amastin family protein [Halorientalis regularis]|jgi:predicted membrane channel-forming protein YqfA (hemolysin III family)|uniref:Uncharacterized protein n=1 Tax=Halorientalis regularis TaxID=660518 RepID=A0A1G7FEX3_9EURY|nr:hypothetical protein [Halorientalis regularis]SDE74456.1 hypothetical protein SAMN05216218_101162 [Halorientalis regularis]